MRCYCLCTDLVPWNLFVTLEILCHSKPVAFQPKLQFEQTPFAVLDLLQALCKLSKCITWSRMIKDATLHLLFLSTLVCGICISWIVNAEQPKFRDHKQRVHLLVGPVASCMESARV